MSEKLIYVGVVSTILTIIIFFILHSAFKRLKKDLKNYDLLSQGVFTLITLLCVLVLSVYINPKISLYFLLFALGGFCIELVADYF